MAALKALVIKIVGIASFPMPVPTIPIVMMRQSAMMRQSLLCSGGKRAYFYTQYAASSGLCAKSIGLGMNDKKLVLGNAIQDGHGGEHGVSSDDGKKYWGN